MNIWVNGKKSIKQQYFYLLYNIASIVGKVGFDEVPPKIEG